MTFVVGLKETRLGLKDASLGLKDSAIGLKAGAVGSKAANSAGSGAILDLDLLVVNLFPKLLNFAVLFFKLLIRSICIIIILFFIML
jgi:hypothetical protein